MRRLLSVRVPRTVVSNVLELAGLSAVAGGVWMQFGDAVGLIAGGVAAILYAVGLDRGEP